MNVSGLKKARRVTITPTTIIISGEKAKVKKDLITGFHFLRAKLGNITIYDFYLLNDKNVILMSV